MLHDLNHPRRTYFLCFAIPTLLALIVVTVARVLYGSTPRTEAIAEALVPSAFALGLTAIIYVASTEGHIGTTVFNFSHGPKRKALTFWLCLNIALAATVCAIIPITVYEAFIMSADAEWWTRLVLASIAVPVASFSFQVAVTRSLHERINKRKAQRPNPLVAQAE